MKVTVLMGSPRKKDSYRICQMIEQSFDPESKVEFDYLFLKDFHIEDCRGCDQCFQKGENHCPCQDELSVLKERLLEADGIIFASPVYACQITGTMKRVLDRLSYLFHRQEFVGKPALTVVTTGGGGQKPTGNYLKMTACGWGCHLVGELNLVPSRFFESRQGQPAPWGYSQTYHDAKREEIQKSAKRLEQAMKSKELPVPSFYDIFMFQCLRSKTFVSKADYEFWEKKGWLDSQYFYDVKMGSLKILFAKMMKAYIDQAAKRLLGAEKQLSK